MYLEWLDLLHAFLTFLKLTSCQAESIARAEFSRSAESQSMQWRYVMHYVCKLHVESCIHVLCHLRPSHTDHNCFAGLFCARPDSTSVGCRTVRFRWIPLKGFSPTLHHITYLKTANIRFCLSLIHVCSVVCMIVVYGHPKLEHVHPMVHPMAYGITCIQTACIDAWCDRPCVRFMWLEVFRAMRASQRGSSLCTGGMRECNAVWVKPCRQCHTHAYELETC